MKAFCKAFDFSVSLPGIIELEKSTTLIKNGLQLCSSTYYLFRSLRNRFDKGVR